MQKWIRAAQSFQRAKESEQGANALSERVRMSSAHVDASARQERQARAQRSASQLERFLDSDEGRDALDLLKTSGRHIIFGEERDGGGSGVVYFLNGEGLQQSIEAMGMWTAYSKPEDIRKPELSPIDPLQAVSAFADLRGKDPDELMAWLESELNKIADAAPAVS